MKEKEYRKGFTLVELLTVIVILSIIMVIGIPSVLESVEVSRQKVFKEYMQKVYNASIQEIVMRDEFYQYPRPSGYEYLEYVYDLKDDLELGNIGNYKGIVTVIYYGPNYARSLKERGWNIEEDVAYYDIRLMDDYHYSYIRTQDGVTAENMYIWSFDEVIEEDREWVESEYNKTNYMAYTIKYKDDIMKYYIGVDGATNKIFLNTIPS